MTARHPYPGRRNDLPPAWDGVPIEWGDWSTARTTLAYHLTVNQLACRACGLIDEDQHNVGFVIVVGSLEDNGTRTRRARFHAARCRGCGADVVHDLDSDEVWELDATDYADAGSYADQATLF